MATGVEAAPRAFSAFSMLWDRNCVAQDSVWRHRYGGFTSQQIIDLMLTLNRDDGVTFLFSTHDHRVEQHARRVVAISDGRLTETKRAAA